MHEYLAAVSTLEHFLTDIIGAFNILFTPK